jgi:hypothetical protein
MLPEAEIFRPAGRLKKGNATNTVRTAREALILVNKLSDFLINE